MLVSLVIRRKQGWIFEIYHEDLKVQLLERDRSKAVHVGVKYLL